MASETIKVVSVTAIFPGGRVVKGFARCLPNRTDEIFQVWPCEGKADTALINPSLAETVEFIIEYEK